MNEEQIELAEFTINFDQILNGAVELKERIEELKQEQKELAKSEDDVTEALVSNEAVLKALNAEYRQHINELSKSSQEAQVAVSREEQLTNAFDREVTSIADAREQTKALTELRNTANLTTEEGIAEVEKLNKAIDANNEFIKENVDELAKQKINVGNYADGIKGAIGQLNPFNKGLDGMIGFLTGGTAGLTAMGAAFKTLTTSILGATKAALAFIATPIGAVLAAVAATLGLVYNAFTTTTEGADKLTAATRPLAAVFETFKGTLQEIGLILIENVEKAFTSIGGVIDAIRNRSIGQLFDVISDSLDKAGDSFNKTSGAITKFVEGTPEAIKAGQELDALIKSYEESQIVTAKLIPELNRDLREQKILADDITLSNEARREAAQKALDLNERIIVEKQKELNLELKIAEKEASFNDTSRAEKLEIAKIEGKIAQAEADALGQRLRINNTFNTINKKATADRIQSQQELVELYKTEQGLSAQTLANEIEIAEQVAEKQKAVYDEQLKSQLISRQVYDAQILKLDDELADKRAQLAVDESQRIVNSIREEIELRRGAAIFLSEEEANIRKTANETLLIEQQELAQIQLERGLINQQEFTDAIRDLTESNRVANEQIDAEREAIKRQEELELRALRFEEELALSEEEGATKFEIEQARIEEERQVALEAEEFNRQQGLVSEELYNARVADINRQAAIDQAQTQIQISKKLAETRIAIADSALTAIQSLTDRDTKFGKALAVAKALINTYQGITAGVALGFPLAIPAVAAAAATGFKAVKDILKTKTPSAKGGNIASGSGGAIGSGAVSGLSGISSDFGSLNSNQSSLTAVAASGNRAVQSQITNDADNALLSQSVSNAVREGAREGTAQGSQEGITNLSNNNAIRNVNTF